MKIITLFVLLFSVNTVAFSQNNSISDFFISNIDSLVNKQLTFQEQTRNPEAVVFLKDSIISYYYDDVTLPCENQPTISNYTYNINGLVTLLESRDTPEEGCDQNKRQDIFTYDEAKVTSHLIKYYDIDTNQWVNYSKRVYQYDTNNNEIEDLWVNWDSQNSTWYNYLKFIKVYDQDLIIQEKREKWLSATNEWFWDLEHTYSYTSVNNIEEHIYNLWDYGLNHWETLQKRTYIYDANSNILEFVDYRKNQSEEVYEWNKIFKHNYTYDSDNQLIEDLSYTSWNNEINDWEALFKYSYANNSFGDPLQIQLYSWDFILEDWNNKWIKFVVYNTENQKIEELKQNWDTSISDWENHSLSTITYNEFSKTVQNKLEYWSGSSWYNGEENNLEYDEYQNVIYIHGNDMYDWWNIYYYYSEYDIVLNIDGELKENSVFIYPNPSNDSITINGLENEAVIIIYDVSGKKVLETTTVNIIDIYSLNKGLYFVAIQQGEITKNVKLIKN